MAYPENKLLKNKAEELKHGKLQLASVSLGYEKSQGQRLRLGENILCFLNGNRDVSFAYALGSTAEGTENEFSDKDIGIVARDDESLVHLLQNSGKIYPSFGPLVGHYKINPYHSYVVYDTETGPSPLDIYFVTEEMNALMTDGKSKTIVDHISSSTDEKLTSALLLEKLIYSAYASVLDVSIQQRNRQNEDAVATLNSLRSNQLIHLLRIVKGLNIPHIKSVNLNEFSQELRTLFEGTFACPIDESISEALSATETLLTLLISEAKGIFAKQQVLELVNNANLFRKLGELTLAKELFTSAINFKNSEGDRLEITKNHGSSSKVVEYLDGLNEVSFATVEKTTNNQTKLLVILRDDESLNVFVESGEVNLSQIYPDRQVLRLSPVHFQIIGNGEQIIDVFAASSSLYYTSKKSQSHRLVDNKNVQNQSYNSDWIRYKEYAELAGERELIVKGIVRTFRLLSKINKNDLVTFTYILNSVRTGQLIPLMRLAGLKSDEILNLTYAKPNQESVRESIMAAMILFTEAFIRIREQYKLQDLDSFVKKSFKLVEFFTE